MNETIIAGMLGCLGGMVRGLVGLMKAFSAKRQINWQYWLLSVAIAAVIGAFTGIIFNFDYRLSLLSGYAGTDVIEGIYKSFKVEKVYVQRK